MTSLYRINYYLVSHRRDAFIEFIKGQFKGPFILGMLDLRTGCDIMLQLERLIEEHSENPKNSRLKSLVPMIGTFFTPLPLQRTLLEYDAKYKIIARKFIPPSFNDIRHILNFAQIHAISGDLKLLTFDGDCTLYEDGANFSSDSQLVEDICELLCTFKLYVVIVTAAGYPRRPDLYETRLKGLLDGFKQSKLTPDVLSRFYVLGGECNYLFKCNADCKLETVEANEYQTSDMLSWSTENINKLLDIAEQDILRNCKLLDIKVRLIRKERAVGIVPDKRYSNKLRREALEELTLSAQNALMTSSIDIPWCAFNGGNDVFVDVGNKLIGVLALQSYLGAKEQETLHVGDQFLSTGNDISTRRTSTTVWVSNPGETVQILDLLLSDLETTRGIGRRNRRGVFYSELP